MALLCSLLNVDDSLLLLDSEVFHLLAILGVHALVVFVKVNVLASIKALIVVLHEVY